MKPERLLAIAKILMDVSEELLAVEIPKPKELEAPEPASKKVTLDDVRAAAKACIDFEGNMDSVKAALAKYKVTKLSELDPSVYADFIKLF